MTLYVFSRSRSRPPLISPQAFILLREFILGSNDTGLVCADNTTVGGVDPALVPGGILPGQSSILYGSGTATSEYLAPSEMIASWEAFFSSIVAAETPGATVTNGPVLMF